MFKHYKVIFIILSLILINSGCTISSQVDSAPTKDQQVQQIVNSMSHDQKIDGLMMVPADYALLHQDKNFGGVFWPGWQLKGKTFKQIQTANLQLKNSTSTPLIAIDQEGGLVDRLKFITDISEHLDQGVEDFVLKYFEKVPGDGKVIVELPSQDEIGRLYASLSDEKKQEFLLDYQKLYVFGLAKTLDDAGFTVNFGPVADLSPLDGSKTQLDREARVFGSNASNTQELLSAYARGFLDYQNGSGTRVMFTFKHFPGIGSAIGDTHQPGVIVNKNLNQLLASDIMVYQPILPTIPVIMFSQALYPSIDNQHPAVGSMAIRNLLTEDLGYEGIIISDDITMGNLENLNDIAFACDMMLSVESSMIPKNKTINDRGSGQRTDIIQAMRDALDTLSDEELDIRINKVIKQKISYPIQMVQ